MSLRVNPQRVALFILDETGQMRLESVSVQTVKTGPSLVSSDPFASMVPIMVVYSLAAQMGPRLGAYITSQNDRVWTIFCSGGECDGEA
jgi:hypothetical protein